MPVPHHRIASLAERTPAAPELLLQVIEHHVPYRELNYSLYPSWLAYPWPNAYLRIRGTRPWAYERCDRTALRSEPSAVLSMLDASTQYREGLDAAALAAALRDFAAATPRPAIACFDLNPGQSLRKVSGQLAVLGCRVAAVGKHGELSTLAGAEFSATLGSEPGGPPRTDGLRVRHRILIPPGTRLRLALPRTLAEAARRRPRPGQQVERIEPLPSVFANAASLRSLWPQAGEVHPGQRYRLEFGDDAEGKPQMRAALALEPGALLAAEAEA